MRGERFRQILLPASICLLIGGLLLLAVAGVAFAQLASPAHAIAVEDPSHVALPAPTLLHRGALLYGRSPTAGVDADEVGCSLRSASGRRLPKPMTGLSVILGGSGSVTVGGQELTPLFAVPGYADGDYLSCTDTTGVEPLAIGSRDSLTVAGPLAGIFAVVIGLVCLVIGGVGLIAARAYRRTARQA